MSKSLKRVSSVLADAGFKTEILELSEGTKTAPGAAKAADCALDQIAKSIIFKGAQSGRIYLFITAGGRQVDVDKASALAGEELSRADANAVRQSTGFAIGGVSPVGHPTPPETFFDRRLMDFDLIWAAAGTPKHIFSSNPTDLIAFLGLQVSDFTT